MRLTRAVHLVASKECHSAERKRHRIFPPIDADSRMCSWEFKFERIKIPTGYLSNKCSRESGSFHRPENSRWEPCRGVEPRRCATTNRGEKTDGNPINRLSDCPPWMSIRSAGNGDSH